MPGRARPVSGRGPRGAVDDDIARFHALAEDVHLPPLDTALYTNNIVAKVRGAGGGSGSGGDSDDADADGGVLVLAADTPSSGGGPILPAVRPTSRAGSARAKAEKAPTAAGKLPEARPPHRKHLRKLVALLKDHHERTLSVLRAIHEREGVLAKLCHYTRAFSSAGDAVAPDVQAEAMALIYRLQQHTLAVVEHIQAWRAQLTRPYAFLHRGANYVLQIARDSRALAQSSLGAVFPLRLETYPLASNVPSLRMFQSCMAAPDTGGMVPPVSKVSTVSDPAYLARLRRAEAVIAREFDVQVGLSRELIDLCLAGRFLPCLRTPFVPHCATGVLIHSKERTLKHAATLREQYERLTQPTPLPPELTACVTSSVLLDDDERAVLEDRLWGAEMLVH